jgi:hypothetical protein
MLRIRCVGTFVLMVLALGTAVRSVDRQGKQKAGAPVWRDSFQVDRANLSDTGRNPYCILEPGYRLILGSGKDTLTITVLEEVKLVDGVSTRVVEERETEGGELAEISRNYFAIDKTTGNLYYFGEDVDVYKDGKIVGHEGAWLAGINGARFGLMLPGKPAVGDRYYQEFAPKVAMDRAEVSGVTEEIKVPAGVYRNCLRTRESSAIESGSEDKWYAPGVGLIKDADFTLTKVERIKS